MVIKINIFNKYLEGAMYIAPFIIIYNIFSEYMSKKKTNIAQLLAKKIDKNVNTLVNKLNSKVTVQSNNEVDYTSNTDQVTTTSQIDFTDSIKLVNNKNKSLSNLQTIASVVKTLKSDTNLLSFSDSDVANFCSTFCKTILDANVNVVIDTATKALHKSVLEYFRDGETNSTIQNLSLILGTSVSYGEIKTASSLCSCAGMNDYLNENNGLSCINIYKLSMYQHLINMLGDIEFYKIWFFTVNTPPVPRKNMVNNLKLLIDLLLASNHNLSLQEDDFYCTVNYSKNEAYNANKKIIENYKLLLDLVISDCGLAKNKNKIKLYGQEFGKLLPKLRF